MEGTGGLSPTPMGDGLRRAPELPHVPLRDGANGCFEFGRIGGPQPLGFLRREAAGGQHLVQLPEDAIAVWQPLMGRRIAHATSRRFVITHPKAAAATAYTASSASAGAGVSRTCCSRPAAAAASEPGSSLP